MLVNLCLAGLLIELHTIYDLFSIKSSDYLSLNNDGREPSFIINISPEDIIQEYNERENDNIHLNDFTENFFNPRECEILAARRKIADEMPEHNVILMHGSVVAKDNKAYMFTAPSGVGKSTRTQIWMDEYEGSVVVNGDKPFIKITNDEVIACGSPWSGKEGWNTNVMVPLKAIFFLKRAGENEESSIREICFDEAFSMLLQQTHRPKEVSSMQKTLQLLKMLHGKVKFFSFYSTPTSESVRLAYETAERM